MDLSLILVLVIAAIVALAAWHFIQKRKSKSLRSRFGPEYDSTVRRHSDRSRAEAELERRVKRVERFHIRPLREQDRERFAELWRCNQEHFVDDPGAAIQQADNLLCEVMKARGYPMSEFENRAEDLSVDHPHVVRNYRAAHHIAERHSRGNADTEDLRRAFVYYRDLFAELLETERIREEVKR
jgi:FtsZ-interacting cell division protein ZipA